MDIYIGRHLTGTCPDSLRSADNFCYFLETEDGNRTPVDIRRIFGTSAEDNALCIGSPDEFMVTSNSTSTDFTSVSSCTLNPNFDVARFFSENSSASWFPTFVQWCENNENNIDVCADIVGYSLEIFYYPDQYFSHDPMPD